MTKETNNRPNPFDALIESLGGEENLPMLAGICKNGNVILWKHGKGETPQISHGTGINFDNADGKQLLNFLSKMEYRCSNIGFMHLNINLSPEVKSSKQMSNFINSPNLLCFTSGKEVLVRQEPASATAIILSRLVDKETIYAGASQQEPEHQI